MAERLSDTAVLNLPVAKVQVRTEKDKLKIQWRCSDDASWCEIPTITGIPGSILNWIDAVTPDAPSMYSVWTMNPKPELTYLKLNGIHLDKDRILVSLGVEESVYVMHENLANKYKDK